MGETSHGEGGAGRGDGGEIPVPIIPSHTKEKKKKPCQLPCYSTFYHSLQAQSDNNQFILHAPGLSDPYKSTEIQYMSNPDM